MNYIIVRTLAVLVTSYLTKVGVPVVFALSTGWTALLVALVLAVINHTIKPIIVLFSFVINGLMILLASKIVTGFEIPSLLMAIWFAMVMSVVNWVLHVFK